MGFFSDLRKRVVEFFTGPEPERSEPAARPERKTREPKKPGIFEQIKRVFRREPKKEKRPEPIPEPVPEPLPQSNYDFKGVRLLKLRGRVELGSSGAGDIRDRFVNVPVNADTANAIFNAGSLADAIGEFQKQAPYLADVIRFDRFEFGGDIFDAGDFD